MPKRKEPPILLDRRSKRQKLALNTKSIPALETDTSSIYNNTRHRPRLRNGAPPPSQTFNNLDPAILCNLSLESDKFKEEGIKYEQKYHDDNHNHHNHNHHNHNNHNHNNQRNDIIQIPDLPNIKDLKEEKRERWTDDEIDDLYNVMNIAINELELKSSYLWKTVKHLLKTGRSIGSIKTKFKSLAAGKNKNKYRNSEFCALKNKISATRASTASTRR